MNSSQIALKIGTLMLILPQSDVCAVESCLDVLPANFAEPIANAVGAVTFAGQSWPAYCVSQELNVMASNPQERRACVMLANGNGYIGFLCDDARVLKPLTSVQSYPVPSAMSVPYSPVLGLLRFEEGLACLSDAAHLCSFVQQHPTLQ